MVDGGILQQSEPDVIPLNGAVRRSQLDVTVPG